MYRLSTLCAVGAFAAASSASALTITPTEDAATLANSILGSGVTITASTLTNNSLTTISSGTFTGGGGSDSIGIAEGIILTSGAASSAAGPNSADGTTGAGSQTSLEISFTSETGSLFFNYVWASEEYNEFVDSNFNDTFTFLLSGPGIDETNIALIPGTDQPVEIDTVNNGDNNEFYNDIDFGDTSTPFDIEYDGFTDVFTATATGLQAGEVYTIEMIVSDVGDSLLDSAVFIQGSSFGGAPPTDPGDGMAPVPLPASLPLLLAGLCVFGFMRRRTSA